MASIIHINWNMHMRIFHKNLSAILRLILCPGIFLVMFIGPFHALYANDSLTVKTIGMELARDIANESVKACRK